MVFTPSSNLFCFHGFWTSAAPLHFDSCPPFTRWLIVSHKRSISTNVCAACPMLICNLSPAFSIVELITPGSHYPHTLHHPQHSPTTYWWLTGLPCLLSRVIIVEGNKRNNVAIKLGEIAIAVSFRVKNCNFFFPRLGGNAKKFVWWMSWGKFCELFPLSLPAPINNQWVSQLRAV